ncbi:APG5-domain-containing protein [Anaeromyces robustus]|uniref:Autophagy protein 5 n=1 Tax=Anaeromyces robustus TaxID=1754192 RepID=A0A1Y1XAH0_9FUNG|nr:APG5-domain-containing protein [Anaeromyces robustus]|eukprot:ORX82717.1 APG5-domain-containing protein [Anaeromyces robustus]
MEGENTTTTTNNESDEINYPFENVREKVFNGSIPIKFVVSEEDKSKIPNSIDYELAFYYNIPRCSYFPIHKTEIEEYFISRNVVENGDNIWYSYKDIPLKWHYPVGLLYDIYVNSDDLLPWEITVHFSNYPNNKLINIKDLDTLKDSYLTTLKESDYMRYGNANRVMCLSLDDQSTLWNSLCNLNFKNFWNINSKLLIDTPWSNISARLYINDNVIQERFANISEENTTLKDLIVSWCQEVFTEEEINNNIDNYKFILHGINISIDTPLLWLGQYLSYPDNWLHIIIKQKSS